MGQSLKKERKNIYNEADCGRQEKTITYIDEWMKYRKCSN